MKELKNDAGQLYRDIAERTKGSLLLGVVGPVRTGKSTLVKRFMDLLVLDYVEDGHEKEQAIDELPQSAAGRTIMTTEPKFLPREPVEISFLEDTKIAVRLIDCVGYLVDTAYGHLEEGKERMVKTPWSEEKIPFSKAAEIGTEKVIKNHSTVGIVVTADGSFGEIKREDYIPAEEKTVKELKKIKKPFVMVLNSSKPHSRETIELSDRLNEKYGCPVLPLNCEQMQKEEMNEILKKLLYTFPITKISYQLPKWIGFLEKDNEVKKTIHSVLSEHLNRLDLIQDVYHIPLEKDEKYIKNILLSDVDFSTGKVQYLITLQEQCYYDNISKIAGMPIHSEYQLISLIKNLSEMKREYEKVREAMNDVRRMGYGVVTPQKEEIHLEEPELIHHGNKFGVKIKAESPSIHLIRANIDTEIAPIVGSEEQAKDLIRFLKENQKEDGIWETSIFGKTVEELVFDGIQNKIAVLTEESRQKLQSTMQKVVNESNGGMVCIII